MKIKVDRANFGRRQRKLSKMKKYLLILLTALMMEILIGTSLFLLPAKNSWWQNKEDFSWHKNFLT